MRLAGCQNFIIDVFFHVLLRLGLAGLGVRGALLAAAAARRSGRQCRQSELDLSACAAGREPGQGRPVRRSCRGE